METNLDRFMEHITIIDKEFSNYEDNNKGVIFPCNTIGLLVKCEYLELDKNELQVALFQKKIDELDYEIGKVKRAIPKSEITKKEEDKYTITQKEISVRKIWKVSNAIGVFKCFTKKDEAVKYTQKINAEVFKYL